ncbi:MAG: winged helix-turn-helix domain-containing protein [Acidimicrobiales bacterium]
MDNTRSDAPVAMLAWPRDAARAEDLRMAGVPRLLMLSASSDPPLCDDELQDWVRIPSDPLEVNARMQALQLRAARLRFPAIDENGRVAVGGAWIALSPIEAQLMRALVDHFGSMVPRAELAQRAWPHGAPTRNQLDVRLRDLRRHLRPMGLRISVFRRRGFALEWAN